MTVTGDGDLEVELLDGPAGPSTRTVELRPRRRGRELLLVAIGIAVVVSVGLLGDGGDGDATAAPATTSSTRPRASRPAGNREATTTTRRVSSVPTTRRPTTTTTWPQLVAGTGALLPGAPTGIHLGTVNTNGTVTIIDLDTGDRCTQFVSRDGAWMVWNLPTVGGRLLVQTNGPSVGVDTACGTTDVVPDLRHGYPAAVTHDRIWMTSDRGEQLTERALPSGETTGRTVDLPRFHGSVAVAIGDDLVLGTLGQLTLLDPTTDERRDLGAGHPLAAHGTSLAYVSCPEMRCRLGVVDVATGERRVYDDVEPTTWDQSTFSPDGRLLRVPVPGSNDDQPSSAVVDLDTGAVRIIDEPLQAAQLTADGRWLVGILRGQVVAFNLEEDGFNVVLTPDLREVHGFGLL